MRVTAVLAIRNEEAYLANCLRHLIANDINFVIIGNGSSDASRDIYRRREFAANLVDVHNLRFPGSFALYEQLQSKIAVIERLETDWVVHIDADEIMESYREGETLNAALSRADATGCNAVNFDEFVFLPIEHDYVPEARGHQPILHYYFFQPFAPRLMRAWKKASGLSMVEHGGHLLSGPDLRLAPEHLALRHYIVRSQEHAFAKYTTRIFAADELARGWHAARHQQNRSSFKFPPAGALRRLPCCEQRSFDRSDPWKVHYWKLADLPSAPHSDLTGVAAGVG